MGTRRDQSGPIWPFGNFQVLIFAATEMRSVWRSFVPSSITSCR